MKSDQVDYDNSRFLSCNPKSLYSRLSTKEYLDVEDVSSLYGCHIYYLDMFYYFRNLND
jgi:hypothetical protein